MSDYIRPSSPIIVADHSRHDFLAVPDKLCKKIFVSFLSFFIMQLTYSMENNDIKKLTIELSKFSAPLILTKLTDSNSNIFHFLTDKRQIQFIEPLITNARFDSYDKNSQTVWYALWVFSKCGLTKNDKDIKLHILSKLPLTDLYPYKSLCRELLKRKYNHILLPQVHECVENIKQILARPNDKNKTALQHILEKCANDQEHINNITSLLDGSKLQADYDYFISHFPAIVNSQKEEDKKNWVRQMFENCVQLFLE